MMSVIFGIKDDGRIILAADKRTTSINGRLQDDTSDKINVINAHLALASAGNVAIGTAIMMDVKKLCDTDTLVVEDVVGIIKSFFQRLTETQANTLLAMPFCFLLAGLNSKHEATLISGSNINRKLSITDDVPMALYPPDGTSMQDCCYFFAKNYHVHHDSFVEKTIADISRMSQLVSPTGNKWVFDVADTIGRLYLF